VDESNWSRKIFLPATQAIDLVEGLSAFARFFSGVFLVLALVNSQAATFTLSISSNLCSWFSRGVKIFMRHRDSKI
jgi:hypothetical protein